MNGLQPVSDLDPSDLPEGFTMVPGAAGSPLNSGGPSSGGGGAGAPTTSAQQQRAEADAQKQAILEQALTPDALARLRRIKLVKEEKAVHLENVIASMALSGKLPGPINEGKLIEMLERGSRSAATAASSSSEGAIRIERKKYAFDSDDDDNDDDLL